MTSAAPTSACEEGFPDIRRLVEEASGIALAADKAYLAVARLRPVLEELKAPTLGALTRLARADGSGRLLNRIVQAITVPETSFFRDPEMFELIRTQVLPALRNGRATWRFWSGACSTGQEAYSLAMTVLETSPRPPLEILATDLSAPAVFDAISGVYDRFAVGRGLSAERLARFFESKGSDRWKVKAEVTQLIKFKQANLIGDLRPLGEFDLVLMRNVLIYFAETARADVYRKLGAMIRPGGYLVLGSSETPARLPDGFERVPGIHRPVLRRGGPS
jgi:chemotaxis protein methyltransferase CheR